MIHIKILKSMKRHIIKGFTEDITHEHKKNIKTKLNFYELIISQYKTKVKITIN